ncbi:adenylate cyclase [Devosia sp. YR412]|uniref:adenylate/guanylate cyclase domain-containing protein n=1 Tax=Devosia sp. YR412 TaxID=1881030 RepID=UPI0008D01C75|nr:adenylate/guanylate cyclase domain-containing protein [Devosia sp. YR412]SEQ53867.1 adenylate cyclase [Devosia sp. YR412]
MLDWWRGLPMLVAASVAMLGAALIVLLPDDAAPWRETGLDRLVGLMPLPSSDEIVVVDIGAGWSRSQTARLMTTIADAKPKAVALDIVLSADCAVSATNQTLAMAIAKVPTTLGFLLASGDGQPRPPANIAASQGLALPLIWQAPGAEHACPSFESAAAGSAAASLAGGMDAIIREAPALVVVGDSAYLGLAADVVRLAKGSGSPLIGGDPAWLRIFGAPVEIGPSASLRFQPGSPAQWQTRTVAAATLLDDETVAQRLTDKLVFVGSSAPGAGALRATATSPVHPSVHIHADLAAGLLAGRLPLRHGNANAIEAGVALLGGLGVGVVGIVLAPLFAGMVIIGLVLAWLATTTGYVLQTGGLLDPIEPATILVLAGLAAILTQAARTRRAETAMRRRIGQLLPPDVVARFVREPNLLRLEGEERQVTALFTDIEGFTQSLQGVEPRRFVGILDAYFSGMTRIVLAHGGMIDKLVGDAMHALFNAPADLDNHVDKAIACAVEMQVFAEAFRLQPDMQALNFGRTRIGIETGMVILGDVGAADKIDYTAHGPAINMAARLEEANKALGSSICIGPGAAALATTKLVAAGTIDIRGFGSVAVYNPAASA